MQMAAVAVVEGPEIALGGEDGAQLLARHVAHARVTVAVTQLGELRAQLPHVALLDRGEHGAIDPVAVDREAPDELAHEREPLDGHLPYAARRGRTDQPVQFRLAGGDALDGLRAAASRGAPADALLLKQNDFKSALRQMQRG